MRSPRGQRMVPPGVSYTPRDFMPTKRLSTMSTRPMPLSPGHLHRQSDTHAGLKCQKHRGIVWLALRGSADAIDQGCSCQ